MSELGFGTARVGGVMADRSVDFVRLLSSAIDSGVTFIDTSNIYTQGESEALVGRAVSGRRSEVFVCTKVGYQGSSSRNLAGRLKPLLRPVIRSMGIRRTMVPTSLRGTVAHDFSPAAMTDSVAGSLRRLAMDSVDLLLLHSPSAENLASGESLEVLHDLRDRGMTRLVGISLDRPVDPALLEGVDAVQLPVNAFVKPQLISYLAQLSEAGIGVIGRHALASGRLAHPATEADTGEELDTLTRIAAEAHIRGWSLAEAAFRDVHSLDGVSTTLLGISRPEHLDAGLRWL